MPKIVKEKMLPFRMTKSLYERIQRAAKKEGQTMGFVIRQCLDQGLPQEVRSNESAA